MPSHPYAIRADIAELFSKALAVASDVAILWLVRGHAASLCLLLASEVDCDDRLALSAVTAAATMTECSPYARDLLIAAGEVARDESVLVEPMLELAAAAHVAGRHEMVVAALLELVELQQFTGDVPVSWLVGALVVTHEGDGWPRRLVRNWVVRFGAAHDGLRAVVRDRADH